MPTWCSAISTRRSFWAARCGLTRPRRRRDSVTIARELDLPLARAAWGIHETANEDVARAFRVHAAERGFDYRGCSMIAFGGSGPIHAMRIARKLKIPEVIFPSGAGVMSAFGLLVSPLSHETINSDRHLLDELDASAFEAKFAALTDEVTSFLREGDIGPAEANIVRRLDMRYLGQGYEIEVSLPNDIAPRSFCSGCQRCLQRAMRASSRSASSSSPSRS